MKKLFFVIAHKPTSPLKFTIDYLSSFNENTIILHIDKKADINQFSFIKNYPNVFFSKNRIDIRWGNFSMIEATLGAMLQSRGIEYQYFFLISGDDIPYMSNETMNIFLGENKLEFIHYQDERDCYVNPYDRVLYNYPFYCFNKNIKLVSKIKLKFFQYTKKILKKNRNKNMIEGIELYKGGQWFTIKRDTVDKLLLFLDENPGFKSMFFRSYCPDEMFFHTLLKILLKESDFYTSKKYKNNALRYIDWDSGPEYPAILSEEELLKIEFNRYFFVRKVKPTIVFPDSIKNKFYL